VSTQFAVDLVFKTQGSKQLKDATTKVKNLQAAAKKAQGSIGEASNNIRKFGSTSAAASQGTNKLGSSIGSLVTQLAAVTAAAVGVQKSLSAAFERGTAEKRLQNLTGSTAEYEQALRLARIAAADFGVTQTQATQALGDVYSRLRGVGYGLTEVNEIYRGFNTIAAQSGVAAEDAAGAFLQLGQALGSGKLQGDELRSILERMPQLAQAIASEMNIAAGEVRQAGADGKITGEVMYAALKKASEGSFDLTKTLTEQQVTMNQVKQRAEELQVELGKALAPTFLAAMNKLGEYAMVAAKAMERMNKWAKENADAIEKVVRIGLEIAKIAASIAIVVKAYTLWQKAVAGVAAAKAALLTMSGVGIPLVAAGAVAATGAFLLLNKGVEEVESGIKDLQTESQKQLEIDRQKAAESQEFFRLQGEASKQELEDTKKIAEAQKAITKQIKETTNALDKRFKASESIKTMELELAQQLKTTELAVTDALLDQAEAKLESAKTAQARIKAADEIYKLTIQQAEIEREMARSAVAESVRKAQAQVEMLMLKQKEVEIAVSLAKAEGSLHTAHIEALGVAQQAVAMSQQQLGLRQQIAAAQYQEIDALFKAKQETAKTAFEQNKVFEATKNASGAAASFAQNMNNAATQAERAARATASVGGGVGPSNPSVLQQGGKKTVSQSTFPNYDLNSVNAVLSQQSGVPTFQDSKGNYHIDYQKLAQPYGTGRRIDQLEESIRQHQQSQDPNSVRNQQRATMAMEQMRLQNQYYQGQKDRGVSDAQISVVYGGNTLEFDGEKYVMRDDVDGILRQAVEQMQSSMTRSARTRLDMGLR